jgi:hypothetical protein
MEIRYLISSTFHFITLINYFLEFPVIFFFLFFVILVSNFQALSIKLKN